MTRWIVLLALWSVIALLLRRRWRHGFPIFRYAVYCRFPLLLGGIALLLGPVSLALPQLLRNLFVVEAKQLPYLTAGALFFAWTILMTLETVLEHAGARFEAPPAPSVERLLALLRRGWPWWTALLAAPTIGSALWATTRDRGTLENASDSGAYLLRLSLWAALGALIASALYAIAAVVQRLLSDREIPDSQLLFASLGRMPTLLGRARSRLTKLVPGWLERLGERGDEGALAGYLGERRLAHGHLRNLLMSLLTFGVYLWGALVLRPEKASQIPAIGFLFVIAVFLGWLLPGLSFFGDRYRLPTLLVMVLLVGSAALAFNPDHYFETIAGDDPLPSVSEAFFAPEESPERPGPPFVVVATSGGGIKSAVWSARVLAGLTAADPEFASSLRLISAVSGGSVGSLYYMDWMYAGRHETTRSNRGSLEQMVARAEAGSLFAATWGMAYPDLWRAVFPPFVPATLDRGAALERVWASRLLDTDSTLSQWGAAVKSGALVPLVMNATVAESGKPLLFAPLDIPENWRHGPASGHGRALDCDLSVATAARLSATFPWLTPMSRPREECNGFGLHLADGGYYDNFGVTTALYWLEEVLRPSGNGPGRVDSKALAVLQARGVLLVLIRASPEEDPEGPESEGPSPQSGWLTALAGPVTALVKVQGTTQLSRNEWELRQFADLWQGRYGIRIEPFLFGLPAPASLSWQLSAGELEEIEEAWSGEDTEIAAERARLLECLQGQAACRTTEVPFEARYAPKMKR